MPYKILCGFAAAILCVLTVLPQARAFSPTGYSSVERKEATEPFYIAMLFYKLIDYRPNFAAWITETPEYKAMPAIEQDMYLDEKVGYFKSLFFDIEENAPIIVNVKTQLSPYSREHGGFFIESFRPDLFFSYEYMGNRFAIIPTDIDSYQWYQVSQTDLEDTGVNFEKSTPIDVQLLLVPSAADSSKPTQLGDFEHWVINATVKEIQIWAPGGGRLLWVAQKSAGQDNTLLELFKE
ncbi:MAG: hypothetical protein HND56_05620 [Pseudomonadota bacterium]|nr:hypothetical protein [Pseudomonadota bacterium]QKK05199.1 MAG: hypothetical protein HND56_05620 [Pseudomonadota bacterium]